MSGHESGHRASWWSSPVAVKTARSGVIRRISDAAAGLDQLREWDATQNPAWREAFQLCVASMDGKATPDAARTAFLAAAKSIGRLVSE